MKNILYTIAIVTGCFIMYCCNNSSKENTAKDSSTVNHENHADKAAVETIELNKGDKWVVNAEMKPFINESEKALNDFLANDSKDYMALSELLKEKNSGLINSCTMKGQSHDELHKWLHPHMKLINELSSEKDTAKASVLVESLSKSFQTFHTYFQ